MVVETRSHRLSQVNPEGVDDDPPMPSITDFHVEVPAKSPAQINMVAGLHTIRQHANILLTDLVPVLKSLTANKDEEAYVNNLLSSFLQTCASLPVEEVESGTNKEHSPVPGLTPESIGADLRHKIAQMKTLVGRRLHFQAASHSMSAGGRPKGSSLADQANSDNSIGIMDELSPPPSNKRTRSSHDRGPAAPLIANSFDNEIMIKLSDGQLITQLRRFTPEGLKDFLNDALPRSRATDVSPIRVQSAVQLKSGDINIQMLDSDERDLLWSSPACLEQFLHTARVLRPSYKVLMKGIQPFTVDLVDVMDEEKFITMLRFENPDINTATIGFIDFEYREDVSRPTTIAIEFLELSDANAAVKGGLVWQKQRRETEHFNLTCNLNFPEVHEDYCRRVRASRVDERRRREEEDKRDVSLRQSKMFHPFTALALADVEHFLSHNPSRSSTALQINGREKGKRKRDEDREIEEPSSTSKKRPKMGSSEKYKESLDDSLPPVESEESEAAGVDIDSEEEDEASVVEENGEAVGIEKKLSLSGEASNEEDEEEDDEEDEESKVEKSKVEKGKVEKSEGKKIDGKKSGVEKSKGKKIEGNKSERKKSNDMKDQRLAVTKSSVKKGSVDPRDADESEATDEDESSEGEDGESDESESLEYESPSPPAKVKRKK